jgi:serine/threonine protein kinase
MNINSDDIRAIPFGHVLSDYKFEKVLGQGSFGITYLAVDTMLNRRVAIKEYFPREFAARDSTLTVRAAGNKDDRDNFLWGLKRFLDEARVLAIFDHPNIIQVRRFFEANGTAYLVMDYCDGTPLDELLKTGEVITEKKLEFLINSLLNALEIIHKTNFLHRDIKPANIFIKNDGNPVLLDFGAARQELVSHSKSVTAIATPGYAAFEQYSTHGHQGPWTDIYGLGATLYRVVTGQKPEDATNRMLEDSLIKSQRICEGKFKNSILFAIDAAMAVRPQDRPQSVDQWRKMFSLTEFKQFDTAPVNSSNQNIPPKEDPIIINVLPNDQEKSDPIKEIKVSPIQDKKKYLIGGGVVITLLSSVLYFGVFNGSNQGVVDKNEVTPIILAEPSKNVPNSPSPKNEVERKEPQSTKTVNQKKDCPKNNSYTTWTDCLGSYTYPSGATYKGEWLAGKRSGQGEGVSNDGSKYVGSWLNDRFHGAGVLTFTTGDSYKGGFFEGFFSGKGAYLWASGDRHEGLYARGKANGHGTYYFKDGRKYIGEFLNAKFDGQGAMYDSGGRIIYSGYWANGQAKDNGTDVGSRDVNFAKCKDAAANARKTISLPRKVDNITSIVDMFCSTGSGNKAMFVYRYEVESANSLTQAMLNQYVRENNRKLVCGPDLKIYLPIVDFEYQYFYSRSSSNYSPGALIGKLRYTSNDCN